MWILKDLAGGPVHNKLEHSLRKRWHHKKCRVIWKGIYHSPEGEGVGYTEQSGWTTAYSTYTYIHYGTVIVDKDFSKSTRSLPSGLVIRRLCGQKRLLFFKISIVWKNGQHEALQRKNGIFQQFQSSEDNHEIVLTFFSTKSVRDGLQKYSKSQ